MQKYAGQYILVVEGSISPKDDGVYCTIGGKSSLDLLKDAAANAAAIIATGNCAAFGGLPKANPNPTGAVSVSEIIKDKPVVNIPGCPAIPEVFTGVLAHFLVFGSLPELDHLNRPMPIDLNSDTALNAERLSIISDSIDKMIEFVDQVYLPDLLAIAPYYLEYGGIGEGLGNFLTWGEFPGEDNSDVSKFLVPRAVILNRDLNNIQMPDPRDFARMDIFDLNGTRQKGSSYERVLKHLNLLRGIRGISTHAHIFSENNFPTGAGIASSASGFAALTLATVAAMEMMEFDSPDHSAGEDDNDDDDEEEEEDDADFLGIDEDEEYEN